MTQSGGGEFVGTRQKAIDALCEHFANDALSVEEFERRIDRAHKAESTQELQKLLADLPRGDLPLRREDMGTGTEVVERTQATVPISRVKERGYLVGVLGGGERKGRWVPARQNYTFTVMGGFSLDFREALLAPGPTEVWIFTLMGGVEIIVPPGLAVECDGVAIMGGFDYRENQPLTQDPDAPILRVRGFAMMGGVEVTVRHLGESERDAKRRRRQERKQKKLAEREKRALEKEAKRLGRGGH